MRGRWRERRIAFSSERDVEDAVGCAPAFRRCCDVCRAQAQGSLLREARVGARWTVKHSQDVAAHPTHMRAGKPAPTESLQTLQRHSGGTGCHPAAAGRKAENRGRRTAVSQNRSPAQRVRFCEEEHRSDRAFGLARKRGIRRLRRRRGLGRFLLAQSKESAPGGCNRPRLHKKSTSGVLGAPPYIAIIKRNAEEGECI